MSPPPVWTMKPNRYTTPPASTIYKFYHTLCLSVIIYHSSYYSLRRVLRWWKTNQRSMKQWMIRPSSLNMRRESSKNYIPDKTTMLWLLFWVLTVIISLQNARERVGSEEPTWVQYEGKRYRDTGSKEPDGGWEACWWSERSERDILSWSRWSDALS